MHGKITDNHRTMEARAMGNQFKFPSIPLGLTCKFIFDLTVNLFCLYSAKQYGSNKEWWILIWILANSNKGILTTHRLVILDLAIGQGKELAKPLQIQILAWAATLTKCILGFHYHHTAQNKGIRLT